MRFCFSRAYFAVAATLFAILFPVLHVGGQTPLPPLERAMEMVDSVQLQGPEGIWEYPGEDVKVLIWRAAANHSDRYNITVLEAYDCRLDTGDVIGWLKPTAEPGKYELTQYARRNSGLLDLPGRCSVKIGNNGNSLLISGGEALGFTINPTLLLPRFWRMVRVKIKSKGGEPTEGLRRLYPSDIPFSPRKAQIPL